MEFIECDECRAKPGSPTLCQDCLDRRSGTIVLSSKSYDIVVTSSSKYSGASAHLLSDYNHDQSFEYQLAIEHLIDYLYKKATGSHIGSIKLQIRKDEVFGNPS